MLTSFEQEMVMVFGIGLTAAGVWFATRSATPDRIEPARCRRGLRLVAYGTAVQASAWILRTFAELE